MHKFYCVRVPIGRYMVSFPPSTEKASGERMSGTAPSVHSGVFFCVLGFATCVL